MLDDLVKAGKIRYYGVSVEKVEEALKAIEYPNVQTVQIIFKCFRQKPAELFLPRPKRNAWAFWRASRWPAACSPANCVRIQSSSPTTTATSTATAKHFDVGETFSGVDYKTGLEAVEELRKLVPAGTSMTQFALRWILMFDAVTCAIPGGKRPDQVAENCKASDLPALTSDTMEKAKRIYDAKIRPLVHQRW